MFVKQVQYLVRKYIKAGKPLYELEPSVVRVSSEATLLNNWKHVILPTSNIDISHLIPPSLWVVHHPNFNTNFWYLIPFTFSCKWIVRHLPDDRNITSFQNIAPNCCILNKRMIHKLQENVVLN